jgi:hypothetical protein
MKRALLILIASALLGAASYSVSYLRRTAAARAIEREAIPELAWLQKEFGLEAQEFTRIRQLHEGYLPQCAKMCAMIAEANRQLEALVLATNHVTPAISDKLSEIGRLRQECQSQMLAHFYAVSQAMPPAQGRRYLARMQQLTSLSNMRDHTLSSHASPSQPAPHGHH